MTKPTTENQKKYNSALRLDACADSKGVSKLKIFLFALFSFSTLFFQTHALTLRDASYGDLSNYVGTTNGYNLEKNGNSKFGYYCLNKTITQSAENDKRYQKGPAICEEGRYRSIGSASSLSAIIKGGYAIPSSYKSSYYYNEQERYIFVINALEIDGKIRVVKNKLNFSNSGLYNIKSKRGSNVFSVASLRGPGLTFVMKDDDQVRWATYVNNMYMLDGYAISLSPNGSSYVFDSYRNKAYEYSPFWSYVDAYLFNQSLFPKLMNTVPANVYDIAWNVGNDYRAYYGESSNHNLPFSLMEKRAGTKEDLKIIQEDLKASLTNLNEFSQYYIGMTPEELGINGDPKVPNANESTNATFNQQLASYNQCSSYWENVKTYATYDRGCYRSLMDSAAKQADPDYDAILNRWKKIDAWDGVSDFPVEPKDFVCQRFKSRKEAYKKKRGERFDELVGDAKEVWLNPEGLNLVEKCGNRPTKPVVSEENEAEKYSFFASSGFTNTLKNFFSIRGDEDVPACSFNGNELLLSDYTKDLELLREHKNKCHGLKFFGILKTEPGPDSLFYCSLYSTTKITLLEKWKNCFREENPKRFPIEKVIETMESTGTGGVLKYAKDKTLGNLSDLGNEVLGIVKDPFLSGYKEQLKVKCINSFTIDGIDVFVYLIFFIVIFTFLRYF